VSSALELAHVSRSAGDQIFEGILHCTECSAEYPIIDGIPILVNDVAAYLRTNHSQIVQRRTLTHPLRTLIGDALGPDAAQEQLRRRSSTYCRDHFGMWDPEESEGRAPPGSVLRLLEAALALVDTVPAGPILDLGCSVGATTMRLAERFPDRLVLGLDMSFDFLRTAMSVLDTGAVCYERRRVGMVYDERRFPVPVKAPDQVDFWVCDVAAIPLPTAMASLVVSLNLLDSLHSPWGHLVEASRMLGAQSTLLLSSPYDWAPSATYIENWLGGHSQRGPGRGASEPVVRQMLQATTPYHPDGLTITAEKLQHLWQVWVHERSTVAYDVHVLAARPQPTNSPS